MTFTCIVIYGDVDSKLEYDCHSGNLRWEKEWKTIILAKMERDNEKYPQSI